METLESVGQKWAEYDSLNYMMDLHYLVKQIEIDDEPEFVLDRYKHTDLPKHLLLNNMHIWSLYHHHAELQHSFHILRRSHMRNFYRNYAYMMYKPLLPYPLLLRQSSYLKFPKKICQFHCALFRFLNHKNLLYWCNRELASHTAYR